MGYRGGCATDGSPTSDGGGRCLSRACEPVIRCGFGQCRRADRTGRGESGQSARRCLDRGPVERTPDGEPSAERGALEGAPREPRSLEPRRPLTAPFGAGWNGAMERVSRADTGEHPRRQLAGRNPVGGCAARGTAATVDEAAPGVERAVWSSRSATSRPLTRPGTHPGPVISPMLNYIFRIDMYAPSRVGRLGWAVVLNFIVQGARDRTGTRRSRGDGTVATVTPMSCSGEPSGE